MKKNYSYRFQYPVVLYFDVDASTEAKARQMALRQLRDFNGSFDNGWDAPFNEGRCYLGGKTFGVTVKDVWSSKVDASTLLLMMQTDKEDV